jgi:hypothetical protein
MLSALVKSRRFWASLGAVVLAVYKIKFPESAISDEQVIAVVVAIGAWVNGESIRSSEAKGPTDVA